MGNLVITRTRDLVTKIALNKASGSGEYDLPAGAVVLNPDGTVRIGNLKLLVLLPWHGIHSMHLTQGQQHGSRGFALS
jgi:hypothetical protein